MPQPHTNQSSIPHRVFLELKPLAPPFPLRFWLADYFQPNQVAPITLPKPNHQKPSGFLYPKATLTGTLRT